MNGHLFRNIFKYLTAAVLYYCGIWRILWAVVRMNGLYVFNYHSFNTFNCDYWRFGSLFKANYRKQFQKQIRFFHKFFRPSTELPPVQSDYESLTYCLTFDDGYRDNYDIALPVLLKYKVSAVFFITTGVIGTDGLLWYDRIRWECERQAQPRFWNAARLKRRCRRRLSELKSQKPDSVSVTQVFEKMGDEDHPRMMMSWEEVADAASRGITVGSHTHSHPIMSSLDRQGQEREIALSMEMIERYLQQRTTFFAYPEGGPESFSLETMELLETLGINAAFTTRNGVNRDTEYPLLLKRIGINPSDPVPIVALKLLITSLSERIGGWRWP